jgi:ubiquinone/menaquinone biosynthesis C-methylase UbiE
MTGCLEEARHCKKAYFSKPDCISHEQRKMNGRKHWIQIERIPGPLASSYEKATRLAIDSYYRHVGDEIVSTLSEGTILDLGTGPGFLPIEVAKRSPTINVVGVDLSRKLIETARQNASKAGLAHRVKFHVGNAARLKFQDSSFDMVISTGMLHSLRDPTRVFREIYRVLKKDGEAWIYDPARVSSHIDSEKWKASLIARERFFLKLFKLIKLHRPIRVHTREEIVKAIEDTPFKKYWIHEENNEIKIKLQK